MDVRACNWQWPIFFLYFTTPVIADDMEFVSFPWLIFDECGLGGEAARALFYNKRILF